MVLMQELDGLDVRVPFMGLEEKSYGGSSGESEKSGEEGKLAVHVLNGAMGSKF